MDKKVCLKFAALVACFAGAFLTSAMTSAPPTNQFGISANVRMACEVSLESNSVAAAIGSSYIGTTREFCNSAKGYRLYASPVDGQASGTLSIDGVQIDIRGGREVLILDRNSPALTSRNLFFSGSDAERFELRIEAK